MSFVEDALKFHAEHNGMLAVASKVPLNNREDLALAYTPGVAEPCKAIKENKELSFEYTCRGNTVAIVSDGTRVLGLGDIGPEAAMPVMEGKAVLFKTFGDVDAIPICIDTKDPEEIIETVRRLQPTFAGINLEDFSSPKCYEIEDRLREICDIPVFHDDQHGTAIACLSAVMGALRYVKKDIKDVKVVVNGCGAAGSASASFHRIAGSSGCSTRTVNSFVIFGILLFCFLFAWQKVIVVGRLKRRAVAVQRKIIHRVHQLHLRHNLRADGRAGKLLP